MDEIINNRNDKWFKNIVMKRLSTDQEKEIEGIFQMERKGENMVYGIERVLKRVKLDAKKEGKTEGIAEGKAEGQAENSIKVAKKMLEKGFSFEDIADTTELPISTIKDLTK